MFLQPVVFKPEDFLIQGSVASVDLEICVDDHDMT